MSGRFWTETELEYVKSRYPVVPTQVLCISLDRSERSIYQAAFFLGLKKSEAYLQQLLKEEGERLRKSGKAHQYSKGFVPFNKGKKGKEYLSEQALNGMSKTQFKKGIIPPNRRPVGFERECSKDGYIYVKVAEGMRQLKLKHRLVYEQHFGPIPKGCNVEFKDRDKRNFSPDNLILRTRKENMKINTYHNFGPEIANAIQLRGALNRQINKHVKKLQNG